MRHVFAREECSTTTNVFVVCSCGWHSHVAYDLDGYEKAWLELREHQQAMT